jgi:serine/threonine protein kinase
MAPVIKNFCALLVRSRLLDRPAVQAIYQDWMTVAADPLPVEDFIGWLVQRGHVTAYQARLLTEGRIGNFFLNEYKILERVAKGHMAGVFRAMHPEAGVVALKVLPPSQAGDPALLARFRREARMAVQADHPAVVRTFACGECRGLHYLVMEYLDGETLEEVLGRRRRITPAETARVGLQAAEGPEHLRGKGLVHRDVKPGNLMLTPAPAPYENTLRSHVKILDIGLGRQLTNADGPEGADELTHDGTILGTPDYLAPEQARDPRRVDTRADVYSLGCSLYHALAGKPPFEDTNLVRQILRHATQEPEPLARLNPHVPDALVRVIETMMAKDPERRFQTPGQVAEALKAFLTPARP